MLETGGQQSEHWYREQGTKEWLPSVSTILGILKDGLEFVSPYDLRKAQERGTKVHASTERLEAGETLEKMFFTAQEWDMLGGFIGWHRGAKPTIVLSEHKFANGKLGYAGTLDRLYHFDPTGRVLLDIKTTSAIYPKAWMQVAAYASLAEKDGYKVDRVAILRLTDRSKAKYQYEERTRDEWQADLKAFNRVLATWQYFNRGSQPKVSDLPDTLSL